jgi:hypothetical protein
MIWGFDGRGTHATLAIDVCTYMATVVQSYMLCTYSVCTLYVPSRVLPTMDCNASIHAMLQLAWLSGQVLMTLIGASEESPHTRIPATSKRAPTSRREKNAGTSSSCGDVGIACSYVSCRMQHGLAMQPSLHVCG